MSAKDVPNNMPWLTKQFRRPVVFYSLVGAGSALVVYLQVILPEHKPGTIFYDLKNFMKRSFTHVSKEEMELAMQSSRLKKDNLMTSNNEK
jgi:hypothetical protein